MLCDMACPPADGSFCPLADESVDGLLSPSAANVCLYNKAKIKIFLPPSVSRNSVNIHLHEISSRLRFDCARRTPESPSLIDTVRIELQHLVVELLGGCCALHQPVEVSDILPGLFDNLWAVVIGRSLM